MACNKSICLIFLFLVNSCVTEKQNGNISFLYSSSSYPIRIDVNKTEYFSSLSIKYQNVELTFAEGRMVPVEIEDGITGLVIFARGSILHLNNTDFTKKKYWVNDYLLFRFHPEHYVGIILDQKLTKTPGSLREDDVWTILEKHFSFAFSNGMEAVIPDRGSYGLKTNEVSIVFNSKKSENTVLP